MINKHNNIIKLLFSIAAIMYCSLLAAHDKNTAPYEVNPFADRNCNVIIPDATLSVSENIHADILSLFRKEIQHLKTKNVNIRLLKFTESPVAKHYLFQQQYHNIPVYNAQLKINIAAESNKVISVYDNSYNTETWNIHSIQTAVDALKNSPAISSFENKFSDADFLLKEINIAVINEIPAVAYRFRIHDEAQHEFREYLVNANGEILLSVSLNCNHRSNAVALVHLPDPVTRAKSQYTPPFVDANNTTNSSLDAQRVQVQLDVSEASGLYILENDYIAIKDFDAPFFAPPVSSIAEFIFDRSQAGFEQVNAFYHITEYQKYLQSLGFNNLPGYQIQVDAHALNGDDNSLFSAATNPPRLYFGTGGVADAEDADVIIHEYGHALSDAASGTNFGNERRALDEGIGDYFATSYSKAIDTFRWADMFTWDGHNEYWEGRNATANKIYPDDLTGSIHSNGEIWSSALMEVWNNIGRETTDKLMLQTLYALATNMTLKDAAYEFIRTDSLLYSGSHFCDIYYPLLKKGLVDSLVIDICQMYDTDLLVDAGEDKTICIGDSILIGTTAENHNSNYIWQVSENEIIGNEAVIKVAPEATTTYFLRRTTAEGKYNIDSVTVTVAFCDIAVYNTIGFKDGTSPLKIIIPPAAENAAIRLTDISGKILREEKNINGGVFYLDSKPLSSGVYILSIYTGKKPKSYRLVKVSQP